MPSLSTNQRSVILPFIDKQRDKLNFRNTLKSLKKTINLWKWRGLSLSGKIQVIKTFPIPKLMYRASVLPISKDPLFFVILSGKGKMRSKVERGNLNILDIGSMARTRRV